MKRFPPVGLLLLICCVFFSGALFADQVSDAAAAMDRGDALAAETILVQFLATRPIDASALGLLGAVYDTEHKYSEAAAVYRRALQVAPHSAAVWNNYANHQLATGDVAGARASYLKVLAIDRSRTNANLQLAAIAVQQKSGTEALRYLDQLPSAQRSLPPVEIVTMQALFLARRDTDAQAILATLSNGAEADPRLSFSAGLALVNIGKYNEAEKLFSRTLEKVPGNFDVLTNLGLAAYHAGHLNRAQEVLEAATAQKPQDVETLANLAGVDNALNQRQAALSLLAEAARLDPTRATVQRSLGDTASALGYYADALIAYDKYVQLAPKDESGRREQAFMQAASGHKQEGMAALSQYLRAHPNDATAHYELGILEAQTDQADASQHLNKAVTLEPDSVPARFGRGVLNFLAGNASTALPDLEFAARRTPDNSNILDRLGEVYIALNRPADAVSVLRKATDLNPQDARILMHLSHAQSKLGQSDEARATLARFRAIGSDQIGRVPRAGFVEFLSLPPDQQQARYRAELEKRFHENPQDALVAVRYLKLMLEDGNGDAAHAVAAHLLDLKPAVPLGVEAGKALLDAGLPKDARMLLEYAVNSSPTPDGKLALAVALSQTESPVAGLNQLAAIPEAQRSEEYYLAQAQMLEAAGKYNDAYSSLTAALQRNRTNADVYEQTALFLARHGRAADGLKVLNGFSGINESPNVLLVKAGLLIAAQRAGDAESVLKGIQSRWPEWAQSYVTYGILLEGQKRAAEAKTQLETAISLGANGTEPYYYLAKSTLDATPDRVDDAAKAITQALADAPEDPGVQALAGRIDYEQRKYDSAVQHLETAVRIRPNYLQARFTLAQAYRALGRNEDAARESKEFQRLRAANPNGDEDELGIGKP